MKNNVIIFIILAALFTGFAAVSVLVYFTDGKNKKLLKRKLAIGASIIALTGVVNGCKPVVSCYDVAVDPVVICTDSVNSIGEIVIKNTDTAIKFDCMYFFYQTVSYRVMKDNVTVLSDSCELVQEQELKKMTVQFSNTLITGNYSLNLFYYGIDEIPADAVPFHKFKLKVID